MTQTPVAAKSVSDRRCTAGKLTGTVNLAPLAEAALEATYEHKPEAHHEGTDEKHGATSPAVNVDDSRNCTKMLDDGSPVVTTKKRTGHDDVKDILNRVGDEVSTASGQTSTLEDVDNVVPITLVSGGLSQKANCELTS